MKPFLRFLLALFFIHPPKNLIALNQAEPKKVHHWASTAPTSHPHVSLELSNVASVCYSFTQGRDTSHLQVKWTASHQHAVRALLNQAIWWRTRRKCLICIWNVPHPPQNRWAKTSRRAYCWVQFYYWMWFWSINERLFVPFLCWCCGQAENLQLPNSAQRDWSQSVRL